MSIKEKILEQDGKLIVSRSQDVEALLKDNQRLANELPSMHGDHAGRFVARVPLVLAEQWSRECGAAIGSQEFGLYMKSKIQSPEYSRLRVKGY